MRGARPSRRSKSVSDIDPDLVFESAVVLLCIAGFAAIAAVVIVWGA